MYYKVDLERVELKKDTKDSLNEKFLQVIVPLDDEEDNPFETEFEDIKD